MNQSNSEFGNLELDELRQFAVTPRCDLAQVLNRDL